MRILVGTRTLNPVPLTMRTMIMTVFNVAKALNQRTLFRFVTAPREKATALASSVTWGAGKNKTALNAEVMQPRLSGAAVDE